MSQNKVALIILDGWGKGKGDNTDAIHLAKTPFVDSLYSKYPNTNLITFGEDVGLPEGQMGNSEVGHLNIGAGRVVYQDLVKINKSIQDKSFYENQVLNEALDFAQSKNKKIHVMGLVSDGGIHSSQEHLHAICNLAYTKGISNLFIHAFTDGRDTDPKSGLSFLQKLTTHTQNTTGTIASVIGRYYAMDRDKRWERVKLAYDLLTTGKGEKSSDILASIEKSYTNGVTDEFIKPIVAVDTDNNPVAKIEEGDVVICFNYRTDRCREITEVLTQKNLPEFEMHTIKLHYVTMTNYDSTFKDVQIMFEKDNLKMTLGEVVSNQGLKQIRIAETEKYPHVTFFFSGGREKPFEGESRILVNSPKVATYDLQPEMSAYEVTDKIVHEIEKESADFICLNFANPDMVGHTGIQEAVIKACETIDECSQRVVETGLKHGYQFVIIADHGNAEKNFNNDGSAHTAHTTNLVPCFVISNKVKSLKNGKLADVAPTIIELLQIEKPKEMTGESLVNG